MRNKSSVRSGLREWVRKISEGNTDLERGGSTENAGYRQKAMGHANVYLECKWGASTGYKEREFVMSIGYRIEGNLNG